MSDARPTPSCSPSSDAAVLGPYTLAQVMDLYLDEGLTLAEIGARADRSGSLVAAVLKQGTGMTPRELRQRAGWLGGKTPPDVADRVVKAYRDNPTWSVQQIRVHTGVDARLIRRALSAAGIDEEEIVERGKDVFRQNGRQPKTQYAGRPLKSRGR